MTMIIQLFGMDRAVQRANRTLVLQNNILLKKNLVKYI